MKIVRLSWAPSPSISVEGQQVRIFDTETLEVYGQSELSPTTMAFSTSVPEGVTVRGSVTTVRGDDQVTDVSDPISVGYGPLQGVSELVIGLVVPEPMGR